jgi:hypothetical protein
VTALSLRPPPLNSIWTWPTSLIASSSLSVSLLRFPSAEVLIWWQRRAGPLTATHVWGSRLQRPQGLRCSGGMCVAHAAFHVEVESTWEAQQRPQQRLHGDDGSLAMTCFFTACSLRRTCKCPWKFQFFVFICNLLLFFVLLMFNLVVTAACKFRCWCVHNVPI